MATTVLEDDLIRISQMRTTWRSQAFNVQTQSLINLRQTNGAARLQARITMSVLTKEEKDYFEAVVLAAAYNFDAIQFTLPREFYYYAGQQVAEDIVIHSSSNLQAGTNTVVLDRAGAPSFPTGSTIFQGMIIQFENDTSMYRVNSYDPTTGTTILFPNLRKAIEVGDVVEYQNPKFTGHITNNPSTRYLPDAEDYAVYQLRLDETL